MPSEDEIQDYMLRFNQVVGDLHEINQETLFYRRDWDNQSDQQKNRKKTELTTRMDQRIAELEVLKAELLAFPNTAVADPPIP